MKISIIISVYNTEKYLHECLDSVVNQSMNKNDFEVIIINDGSKDNSLKIIKEYTKKHKEFILIDKENTGLADSRNKGLDIATGDYVLFLDSDDYLELNAIETIIDNIKNNKADIYLYESQKFTKNEKFSDVNKSIFNKLPDYVTLDKNPMLCKIIRSTPIVYSKKIYDKVRFIPKTLHEDNYFCLVSYAMTDKIFITRKCIYNVRIRADNSSITQNNNYKSFIDFYINLTKATDKIKNKKIIKYNLNQLIIYRHRYIKKSQEKKESIIYINNFLKEIKNKKIINSYEYLYYKVYKCLKLFKLFIENKKKDDKND